MENTAVEETTANFPITTGNFTLTSNWSRISSHKSPTPRPESGFDLPVVGLSNGLFHYVHVPALICMFTSFVCVMAILVTSFRFQSYRTFFSWNKSDRFVVYLAICDGMFNFSHSFDHAQMLITKHHVMPVQLCEFYAFMLIEFVTAQNLIVNVIALNVFLLMYFGININFGTYDWKLLLYAFGVPFVGGTITAALGLLGSNGAS